MFNILSCLLCDFSAVNQCFRLQLPCGSHQTAEAGRRAFTSAKGQAEDERTFPPHWRLVFVFLLQFWSQMNHLTAALLLFATEKQRVIESCRDLAGLAQGWDPSDRGGNKPGESLWTVWESRERLYLWVRRSMASGFGLTLSRYMIVTVKCVCLYAGPDIWLEYAQYSIGGMGSPGGIDRVRSVFERAVTAVGLHMTKGQTLWEAYREFENAILSTIQVSVWITWRDLISSQKYALLVVLFITCPTERFTQKILKAALDKARLAFTNSQTSHWSALIIAIGVIIRSFSKNMNIWDAELNYFDVKLNGPFPSDTIFSAVSSQPPPGKIPSHEEQELLNAQLERIHTLFRRQLAVPLMGEHDALTVQTGCKMEWTHVAKAVCHNPPEKTVKYLIWKSNAAMCDDLSGFGCDVSIKMLCRFRKRTALLLRFVTGVNKRQPDGLVEPNGEQRHLCYFWNPFSLVELFTEVWGWD